jgi:hypothetical protein
MDTIELTKLLDDGVDLDVLLGLLCFGDMIELTRLPPIDWLLIDVIELMLLPLNEEVDFGEPPIKEVNSELVVDIDGREGIVAGGDNKPLGGFFYHSLALAASSGGSGPSVNAVFNSSCVMNPLATNVSPRATTSDGLTLPRRVPL